MKEAKLVVVLLLLLVVVVAVVDCESSSEWQLLTKQNFSSQIRQNPYILLFITLPWSGESRSLMKEVAHVVSDRQQEEFRSLKLMFMFRNTEKMLADAIIAAAAAPAPNEEEEEEITILFYLHSVSYKYRGPFRALNILSSLLPHISNSNSSSNQPQPPLLNTPDHLNSFLASTDKALLLLEFCGWTPKLLANHNINHFGVGVQEDLLGNNFNAEANQTLADTRKNNQKVAGDEILKCGVENSFNGVPWLGQFSSVNETASFEEVENVSSGVISSCTLQEFQQFESFFSKFMNVAREFFLAPERHRFGLVSERSMLSSLGLEDSSSWLAVFHVAGCPTCSRILKEEDDLKDVLQMDSSVVTELEGDRHDIELVLPANKPSIILFVDRSSDSSETRGKGKEALDTFRELALHYHGSYQMGEPKRAKPEKSSVQDYQSWGGKSKHPRLKLSLTAQKIKLKEKLSTIMILNEDKHVTLDKLSSDQEGSSLHKILAHLLQQNKEVFKEGLVSNSVDSDKDQLPQRASLSAKMNEENSELTDGEPSSEYDEEKTAFYVDKSKQLISLEAHQSVTALEEVATAQDLVVEEKSFENVVVEEKSSEDAILEEKGFLLVDNLGEQQLHFQGFEGSFFFSDGNYRLLRALTGGSNIPSLVIIDPLLQQHYVLPQESDFSYSSLADFLSGFVNGTLPPYQLSVSIIQSPREATVPPFVNVDFHEVDSIPQIAIHRLSELVLGVNQSNTNNVVHAWNRDVLVLFSNSWCGFCQRMELVVREVYRAVKGYMNVLRSGSRNGEKVFNGDNLKDALVELPLIYLMDCTLNDCSLILKSMDQREVYPALILFPAESRNAILYDGDMAVADIIRFIADQGSNLRNLISNKGIIWNVAKRGGGNQNPFKEVSPTEIRDEISTSNFKSHEVLLKDRELERVGEYNQIKSHTSKDLHERAPHVVAGSILVATEKLLGVQPFDKSVILIVKADQSNGFQGLIINKHIRWESLHELEERLEMLKKAPLSFGGPLMIRGMPLVSLTRSATKDQYPEVLPGVYFVDQVATIHEIKEFKSDDQSIADFWFFVGYSSWGWEQLFGEIAEGAWNVTDDGIQHLNWP
ncbi:uncharacterized protein LOC115981869 isoform X3 [Quercus lobata]|uniref:uncharacterized protein LOC115981869 isoform X3 n=1 Tax=Quercus lobata TaxID=97700 RepID=UPI001247B475|nr:uncharacterized protein LOC115981869 isoform X3 [Quercus lobata]